MLSCVWTILLIWTPKLGSPKIYWLRWFSFHFFPYVFDKLDGDELHVACSDPLGDDGGDVCGETDEDDLDGIGGDFSSF